MNNSKLFNYVVGVGVLLIIVAATGGYFYGLKSGYIAGQTASQAEIDGLRSKLAAYFPPLPEEIFSLAGIIKDIGKDFIKIEIASLLQSPPPPGSRTQTELRTVKIGLQTAITEFTFDTVSVPTPTGEGVLPPETPEKKISFSSLKVGDQVTVEASENIKSKIEFTATKIQQIPTATPPAQPTDIQTPSL